MLAWTIFRHGIPRNLLAFSIFCLLLFSRMIFSWVKSDIFPNINATLFFIGTTFILLLVIRTIKGKKEETLAKFSRFLTMTCAVLIGYESLTILFGSKDNSFSYGTPMQLKTWVGNKPNIYVLMFDEYQGNNGLRKMTGYSNEEQVAFLRHEGFTIANNPISTYDHTVYSIPSLFMMDTLHFKTTNTSMTKMKVLTASSLVYKNNPLIKYLAQNGYRTRNFSIFRIADEKPLSAIWIETTWLELQLFRTFPFWARNDLLNALPSNSIQKLAGTLLARTVKHNRKTIDSTFATIGESKQPQFVFSHFLLPHPPLMIDSNGNERSFNKAMFETNLLSSSFKESYLGQVKYANYLIRKFIETIDRKDPESVVFILSDHGCRALAKDTEDVFNIQWAMRIPGKDPLAGVADVQLVNTFRILLNQVAGQQLPMLHSTPRY